MQPLELILVVVNAVVIPLGSTIGFMLWNKITGIEKEQEASAIRIWKQLEGLGKEIDQVRLNYLDRFSDIKETLRLNHLELIRNITKLDLCLTTHVAQSHTYDKLNEG